MTKEIQRRIALYQNLSVSRGDHVALAHGGTLDFFADLFAVWSVGACAACLNPDLTQGEIENVIAFIDAKAIAVGRGSDWSQDHLGRPVICGAEHIENGAVPSDIVQAGQGLDDPALILFTSGTTGLPKGVVHTFRSLLARMTLNRYHISKDALTNTLCVLPTHFGHGLIGNCLTPLMAGANLFLYPDSGLIIAPILGRILTENAITFMSSVPTLWKIVGKMGKAPERQTLKQVHLGSAPLSAELWRGVQSWTGTQNIYNMYGITETANWLAGASAREFDPADGLIGRMWGGQAAVFTREGGYRRQGEGELVVQSPSLMQGYLQRADLTAEVLKGGWFHTGDIGRIDAAEVICLTGRMKSEINKAGMKVHPEEVDHLLERHPDVAEACSFGVADTISSELVGAALVPVDGASLDKKQLRAWCAERIKKESVPDKWYFVDAIPKTDRGKVNRTTVMEKCIGGKI